MAISKLEGRIVIPTGDWTGTLTESGGGGSQPVTLSAANTYYWSSAGNDSVDMAAKIKAALEAASPNTRTYTVTIDAGVGGTGRVTVSVGTGVFTLTSVAADFAACMGFSGDLTPSASSFTGTLQAESLWLPNCPYNADVAAIDASTAGNTIAQTAISMAADGTYRRFVGDTHTRNRIFFETVEKAKVWLSGSPTYTNQTLEEWWDDVVNGAEPWAANPGYLVRFYPDADTDATFQTYSIMSPGQVPATPNDPNYDQWWGVSMEVTGT